MTEPLYHDEAIVRSVTYSTRGGHKVTFEMDPEGWEAFKGRETTRCMMVLVEIDNEGQPTEVTPTADAPEPKERRRWEDLTLTQQAGIRCNDTVFQNWLGVSNADDAAAAVRETCGVTSRSQIDESDYAVDVWIDLDERYFAWLRS